MRWYWLLLRRNSHRGRMGDVVRVPVLVARRYLAEGRAWYVDTDGQG
jgi:hypothetical protein